MGYEQSKLILVVDDEAHVRTYLKTVLVDEGFRVATASDGSEALEKIKDEKPDLISLDLVMPKRSGMKFYRDLQTNPDWKGIPTLIVTGHARDDLGREDFEELTISGPGFYLEKPVKPRHYIGAIKKMLGMTSEASLGEETLRKELSNAMAGADEETLKKTLEAIKKKLSEKTA
jgi:CheY-like chemotaxis protein